MKLGLAALLVLCGVVVQAAEKESRKPSQAGEAKPVSCKINSNLASESGKKFVTRTISVPLHDGEVLDGGDLGATAQLPKEIGGTADGKITVSVSQAMHHGKAGTDGIKVETFALSGQAWALNLELGSDKYKLSAICDWDDGQ